MLKLPTLSGIGFFTFTHEFHLNFLSECPSSIWLFKIPAEPFASAGMRPHQSLAALSKLWVADLI